MESNSGSDAATSSSEERASDYKERISLPAEPQTEGIRRSARHYLSLVTFRVGSQLFRVPREGFQKHSHVFSDMFFIKSCSGEPDADDTEGNTDDNPIHLGGIDEGAFEDFLHLLYPEDPTSYGKISLAETSNGSSESIVRWTGVLKLAHMWDFENIKDYCITRLGELDLDIIDKVVMTHKFEINSWCMPVYIALAKRENPLTVEEAQHFTKEFIVKIAEVRELHAARSRGRWDTDDYELKKDVKRIFEIYNSTAATGRG